MVPVMCYEAGDTDAAHTVFDEMQQGDDACGMP
jgi:hypothetical protein